MTDFAQSRRSATPACRIVAISVLGRPAKRPAQNAARMALATSAIDLLAAHPDWHPIDAILFPAGFARTTIPMGRMAPNIRSDILSLEPAGLMFSSLAAALHVECPGVLIISGFDGNRPPDRLFRGDQIMAAFDQHGCVTAVRKIYPSDVDTNGWWQNPYPVSAPDFGHPGRAIQLPSGAIAELATCYDAFAFSERVIGETPNRRHIRYVHFDGQRAVLARPSHRNLLMGDYLDALKRRDPALLLVGIHGFERPGRDGYWQRHGIATASAAMGGIPCIGAAHYAVSLPRPRSTTLAASDVPAGQLTAGSQRRAYALRPDDSLQVSLHGRPALLLRRFDLP